MVFSCQRYFNSPAKHLKLRPSKANTRRLKTGKSCHRNWPKQSINNALQITEVTNFAKRTVEIPKTERQRHRCHEQYLHTSLHFAVLYSFFVNIRFCSTVQLGISLWLRELDKPSLSFRGLQRAPDFPFIEYITRRKSWKIQLLISKTGGKDCKDIFHWQCSTLTLVHYPRISKTSWWASENVLLLAPRLVSFVEKFMYYNFIT